MSRGTLHFPSFPEPIHVERQLAEGGFGFVFQARGQRSNVPYAVKKMFYNETNRDLINREISRMGQLRDLSLRQTGKTAHPHIVAYFGESVVAGVEANLLMEFCSGETGVLIQFVVGFRARVRVGRECRLI
jgi:serine/threonine protein kinase